MQTTVRLKYGTAQYILSERMQSFPTISKIINQVMGYTNIGNYARAQVFRKHINQLNLAEMSTILDLGCGYGENALMVSQALPDKKIFALDIDTKALSRVLMAREKLGLDNLTIHEGKIDTLPQEQFDLIYSVDVFEHIPSEVMPFADCLAKLKTGGHLLVKIPNKVQTTVFNEKYFGDHNEWVDHEHPGQVYFLEDLKNRFKQEGFKVVFASQSDGTLARFAWEVAYFTKKGGAIAQLAALPFCKLLVQLDLLLNPNGSNNGNAITVIGQKVA